MNQILITEKIYITRTLRKKKKIYQVIFIISLVIVTILTGYYINTEYEQRKGESVSKDILKSYESLKDTTIVKDDVLVVALNENVSQVPVEEIEDPISAVYTAQGMQYTVDSVLNIPSLEIKYPVLSETSDALLKISLTKFWGGSANSVGNYCIVGHNYDGKDIFFGKLNRIKNGDLVQLEDRLGRTVNYKVYNSYIVDPTDVSCTSQLTNGKKEVTLITCSDGGRTRLVVKCREVE